MDNSKYKVWVRCMTFNHSDYIQDALKGFCMQQTSFPFVCTIVDDASTDGEQEIIKAYLQKCFDLNDSSLVRKEETEDYSLIFARHKENVNCFFAVYFLKYNHYSIKKSKSPYLEEWNDTKYCALCEGDDYWCSPHKLQCQVDFLESHPNHSLCFHAHYGLSTNGLKKEIHRYDENKEICLMEHMIRGGGFMATASMLYVGKLKDDWPEWAQKAPVGDAPLMLVLAERGFVGYINEVMCCYRVAVPGSWSERMFKDRHMRKEVFKRIIQYKKGFDKWSCYKYHKCVKKAIAYSYIRYYIASLPFGVKLSKRFRKYKKRIFNLLYR